eukprot:14936377-Ditylum_brightwellii.AAC.1
MRHNKNMAKVIQDSSYVLGGASFTSLVDGQGIEQIKNFLRYSRTESEARYLKSTPTSRSKMAEVAMKLSQVHQCNN